MKALLQLMALWALFCTIGCRPSSELPALSATDEVRAHALSSDRTQKREKRITEVQAVSTIVRIVQAAPLNGEAMRSLGPVFTKPGSDGDMIEFFSGGRYLGRAFFYGDGLMWDGIPGFMIKTLSEKDRKSLRTLCLP